MIDLWPVWRSQFFFFDYFLQNNFVLIIKSSDLYTSELVLVNTLKSHPIDRGSIPSTNNFLSKFQILVPPKAFLGCCKKSKLGFTLFLEP